MALKPTTVQFYADQILNCVCTALAAAAEDFEDAAGCPCRACVVPGAPAWDDCDDPCGSVPAGGQLTVNLARMYATTSFPAESRPVLGIRGCAPPATLAGEYVVTLLRCAPSPSPGGCPPGCDELEAVARAVHADVAVIYNALVCCLPTIGGRRRGPKFELGPSRIVGPEGGCVGVEQRVTVALPGCGTCPGEDSPS